MATKLKLALKNQIFILTFKSFVFGLFLYFYNTNAGLVWGGVFAAVSLFLYSRPLFNFSSHSSLFFVLLFLSLWIGGTGSWITDISWWLLTLSFGILLGLKNLILTHRYYWHYFVSFAVSYLLFLNFFILDKSDWFWLKWLAAVILIFLIFKDLLLPEVLSGITALLIGELLWIVAWLPIGFLSSANLLILCLLFIVDVFGYKRLSLKNLGLFITLIIIILGSSYWYI